MGSPECIQSGARRDKEDSSKGKSDRPRDNEEQESNEKRKHRSSKSRKFMNGEEAEGSDNSGRRRSTGEKAESRKRSGGSSRAGSDVDDYEARKETRSKQISKNQEESTLEKLSSFYQDGELENKHERLDKSGSRLHSRGDESERKKSTTKFSDYESLQSRSKGKDDRPFDGELEKPLDKDFRYYERKEIGREKGHGSSDQGQYSRKRLDESDAVRRAEGRSEKLFDHINGNVGDRSVSEKIDLSERKSRILDAHSDRGMKSYEREIKRLDSDGSKGKGRSEAPKEDNKGSFLIHEDISGKERYDDHRHQRNPSDWDIVESRERAFNAEDDSNIWMRERSRRELDHSNRSRSPERSGPWLNESENFWADYDRSSSFRRKDPDKDIYWDDRSKVRDDGWSDRRRDWEGSKDNWKRRQLSGNDRETKDGDMVYDHGREWEVQRRGRDRIDNERPHGRFGSRKDGSRNEAVKTSSNYGILNENYDVIEIQTKPFDHGREESGSTSARRTEGGQQSDPKLTPNNDWPYLREDGIRKNDLYGSGQSVDDLKDRSMDDGTNLRDSDSFRDDSDSQGGKGRGQRGIIPHSTAGGQSSSSGSQLPYGNQEPGCFGRVVPQGVRGSRMGRGGWGRGRDPQQVGLPVAMMGSPFGPLGLPPPGPMQPLAPSMSPAPGPPISPGIFIPPFAPPVWPGARGVEMNMLAVPPSLSPVPPGPSGPRFSPSMGTPPSPAMFFNQPGPGRGAPSNISSTNFNAIVPAGRGQPQEKSPGGWVPPQNNLPPGKAPSRGEQNDYSQNFVDTGMRPQNFIRELELTSVVEDYPKLRELIQKKDEIVANSNSTPMYYKCDLREQVLSPEFFGTKFDVILVDPPWEEYVHRAPGVTDHMEYWTFEEIMNLKIEAIADTPSFIFLWVGDGVGLEQGRQCLKKWGFRRCEDICWVKTNKTNATPGLRHDSHTLFQRSKEHCLMGIKGTVRRSTDGHVIHANIDTDVIIAEEPPYGSTAKPEDMYRIVEHFALGRRRLELFGEDHNIRAGWLTTGKGLSSSNFNAEAYVRNFVDKDGKVWQGGAGRNPPPEAPHLVLTTPDIEALRPKSPMKNQQQVSASISLTTANSSNKKTTGNSPQNYNSLNQEASSSNATAPPPRASPLENFQGREGSNMVPDDRAFDMYRFNVPFGQANPEYLDFESHRTMNVL